MVQNTVYVRTSKVSWQCDLHMFLSCITVGCILFSPALTLDNISGSKSSQDTTYFRMHYCMTLKYIRTT